MEPKCEIRSRDTCIDGWMDEWTAGYVHEWIDGCVIDMVVRFDIGVGHGLDKNNICPYVDT